MASAKQRRVGIYVRISKDRAKEVSTDIQRQAAERYAAGRGWPVVEVYEDKGRSAYNGERRPALARLLADVEAGAITAVVVYKLDRITRSVSDFAGKGGIQKRLQDAGADFVSVSDNFDTSTAMGRAMVQIATVFAELESGIKSERITDWHDHRKALGVAPTGPRAYGYGADHKLVPAEAKVLRAAAAAMLAGQSARSVVAGMNDRGCRTRAGSLWTLRTLRLILQSPHTAGLREIDGVLTEGRWRPILDRDTYNRLCALFTDPARPGGRGPVPRWLLSGIARCGVCGTPLGSKPHKSGPRYLCGPRRGWPGCGRLSIDAATVDGVLSEAITAVLPAAPLKAAMRSMAEHPADVVAQLERELADLARLYGLGDLTQGEWMAAKEGLARRLAGAQEAVDAGRHLALPRHIDWPNLDLAARRAIVSTLLEAVTIAPAIPGGVASERVQLIWRV